MHNLDFIVDLDVKIESHSQDMLAESLVWDEINKLLYWIDLKKPTLRCLNLQTSLIKTIDLDSILVSIMLYQGKMFGISENNLVQINLDCGRTKLIKKLGPLEGTLCNDACIDTLGRLWISVKDREFTNRTGGVFLLDSDGKLSKIVSNMVVANGVSWSPNKQNLYVTDTLQQTILKFDLDFSTGRISNKSIFSQLKNNEGFPDGIFVSNDGDIWSAHWLNSSVIRYASNGKVKAIYRFPADNITACYVIDSNNRTLYACSSMIKYGKQQDLGKHPGCLFSMIIG